mmetsp:Transcript_89178/g.237013  ORF Transcript_89178/g.237013 Transcript_89178/m.237013 type:complete len:239 (-) Transcript_89178:458-1174(-)
MWRRLACAAGARATLRGAVLVHELQDVLGREPALLPRRAPPGLQVQEALGQIGRREGGPGSGRRPAALVDAALGVPLAGRRARAARAVLLMGVGHDQCLHVCILEQQRHCERTKWIVSPAIEPEAPGGIHVEKHVLVAPAAEPVEPQDLDVEHEALLVPLEVGLHEAGQHPSASRVQPQQSAVKKEVVKEVDNHAGGFTAKMRKGSFEAPLMDKLEGVGTEVSRKVGIRVKRHGIVKS